MGSARCSRRWCGPPLPCSPCRRPGVLMSPTMAWKPLPQAVHDGGGLAVDVFGDGDVVAHLCAAVGHGPRVGWVGMVRSATAGCGLRSRGISVATGSRCCMVAVVRTLARICQVVAPERGRLPPQVLRVMTAGG